MEERSVRSDLREFEAIVASDAILRAVLELAPELDLPSWYAGAGCVAGAVWNALHDFESGSHIKDIDLVYFDGSDLSWKAEDSVVRKASRLFADLPIPVEIKNQARVHLWYEERFGRRIPPYRSVEAAIRSWPTTATSVGLRSEKGQKLVTYAPFGLVDVLGMLVRPNKVYVSREIYEAKASRWKACWPNLQVVPWE
jgi:hypothetical protein